MIDIDKFKEMYEDAEISVDEIARYFSIDKYKVYRTAGRNGIYRGRMADKGLKICPICGRRLELNENNFYKDKRKRGRHRGGFYPVCRKCTKERRYQYGKDTLKEYFKKK